MALVIFSQVSFTPGITSEYLSVLAVQRIMTVLRLFSFLKVAISLRIIYKCSDFSLPGRRLSALSYWLAAMKSGQQIDFKGLQSLRKGYNFCCNSQSKTCARLMALARSNELISHPVTMRSSGLTRGMTSLIFMKIYPSTESATFMVEHWVIDPSMLAVCTPFLVFQVSFSLFAMMPPRMVVPLLPPIPTIISPTLPAFLAVWK